MSDLVLVTGASGYIAAHCVQQLLEEGYRVRGTVRSLKDESKIAPIKKIAENLNATDRLELVEADLLKKNSFDDVVVGCKYVLHTASPFIIGGVSDPQATFVTPAVEGTETVLRSAIKAGCVKRIVLTSSCAAIYGDADQKNGVYTEEDWNTTSTLSNGGYSLSKTLAEKKAWEVTGEQDKFDLVTINPALVVGPTLTGRDDTASVAFLRDFLTGKLGSGVPPLTIGYVDVRDVARAHVLAMKTESAKGRYLLAPESLKMGQVAEYLKEKYPTLKLSTSYLPKFLLYIVGPLVAGLSWHFIKHSIGVDLRFDSTKITRELGMPFRPIKDAIIDMAESMMDAGLAPRPKTQ